MGPQSKHNYEELRFIGFTQDLLLPVVREAVPKQSQQVGRHQCGHYLLDDLDDVDDQPIVRDFVITGHILVEVLHELQQHVVLDEVGRHTQQTQLLEHQPVAQHVLFRVPIVAGHQLVRKRG